MPNVKDIAAKAITAVHRTVYKASGGKLLNSGMGMPVVILHNKGRKSGKVYDTMLTSPLQEGDAYILVASYGGDDRHPAWFHNVQDTPQVELTVDGKKAPYVARVADGDERTTLWTALTAAHGNYAGYQTKTDREIPVLVLDPA